MPPLPTNSRISRCGNSRATSSTLGGWNAAASGGTAVSAVAPCLSRQAGQSPSSAPVGSDAPHCGHFFSMFGFASASFIHPPQKQIRENVTGIVETSFPDVFFGQPNHFVVRFLATKEFIIDFSQQWQLPIQIV